MTLIPVTGGRLRGGFPAHAGMDPHAMIAVVCLRSRGFPAHAGMDLSHALSRVPSKQ